MIKILSLITISSLTTVIPTPLLSNISLIERLKQDVGINNSHNEYVPLKEISGFGKAVQEVIVDSKDNIYFCIEGISDLNNGLYKLSVGSDTLIKINNSSSVISIAIDNKDNIYFGKSDFLFPNNNGLYKPSSGSDTPIKINGINKSVFSISIDKFDNVYNGINKGAYKLSVGSDTPTKINRVSDSILSNVIDNSNNLYFAKINGLYTLQTALSWTKEQSQFNLIDSTKKKTWTRNELLTVDGELNIEIKNNNIDKVLFDNRLTA